jgi:type II secretory pathway pseudopilin PulG
MALSLLEVVVVLLILVVLVALLLPAPRMATSARRSQCRNNLKQIMLALHNYHEQYESFPPAYTVDGQGNRLHSWRTLILPYLDQQDLYNSIDLAKPWNDPANAHVAATRVPGYECPATDFSGDQALTTYQACVGEHFAFPSSGVRAIRDFKDGISHTLMIVEVDRAHAVPWMKPEDDAAEYFLNLPADSKLIHPGVVQAALGDGAVRALSAKLPAETRKALLTIDGGEELDEY